MIQSAMELTSLLHPQRLEHSLSTFSSRFIKQMAQLRDKDGLPYLRELQTLEILYRSGIGSWDMHRNILDMIQTRSKHDGVASLSRIVIEEEKNMLRGDDFRDFLDLLQLVVPEVVLTKPWLDGLRWSL